MEKRVYLLGRKGLKIVKKAHERKREETSEIEVPQNEAGKIFTKKIETVCGGVKTTHFLEWDGTRYVPKGSTVEYLYVAGL